MKIIRFQTISPSDAVSPVKYVFTRERERMGRGERDRERDTGRERDRDRRRKNKNKKFKKRIEVCKLDTFFFI